MKHEEKYQEIKNFIDKQDQTAIQIDVPVKSHDDRVVNLLGDSSKEELVFKHRLFDTEYLFEILKQFSNKYGFITNKTLINQDKYFIELRAGNDSVIYLNNFNEKLINKIRFYVNNQNRVLNGKIARTKEKAFISSSVLFVICLLSLVLISMLVLAL